MKNHYEVIVGNIGTVYGGHNYKSAYKDFREYSELALNGYGRCAGEEVTLFKNGEILHELAVERFIE